jgi:hypothetical protein
MTLSGRTVSMGRTSFGPEIHVADTFAPDESQLH